MAYQTLTLSEQALEIILFSLILPELADEDVEELKRAYQFIQDEKQLEENRITQPIGTLPNGSVLTS
jgi:hypothetical protein